MVHTLFPLVYFSLLATFADGPLVGEVVTNSVGMKLAYIPSGTFRMGSAFEDPKHQYDEYPHPVSIARPFRIAVTEVTRGQWKAVMGNVGPGISADDLPVDNVSWKDAVAFCERLSQREGRTYRLPTEAEWEYACRAGVSADSTDRGRLDDSAWYDRNSEDSTHPVGRKTANGWGLFDMLGNVSEWCLDRYVAEYPQGTETPGQPGSGAAQAAARDIRVVRGGSYASFPGSCRCEARSSAPPSYQLKETGFRVVLEESN